MPKMINYQRYKASDLNIHESTRLFLESNWRARQTKMKAWEFCANGQKCGQAIRKQTKQQDTTITAKENPQKQKLYYFTFCVGIDKPHCGCYHVIEAESYNTAREEMFHKFGECWAFQYTEQQWRISKEDYDSMKNWRTVGEWHDGYTQAELFNLKRI